MRGAGRRIPEGRKNVKGYRHAGRRAAVLGLTGAAVVAVAASPALAKSDVGLWVTPRVVHPGQSVHVNASGGDDAYPGEELCLDAHPGRAAWHTIKCVSDNRGTGGPLLDTIRLTHRGTESFRAQLLRLSGPHHRRLVVDRTSGTIVVNIR
jgi:hypothetical protein